MQKFHFTGRQKKYQNLFKNSLWLTVKYLCGFDERAVAQGKITYPMYAHLHGAFLDMVRNIAWRNLFVCMPRGYFKSSMMTVGFVIWKIINNPNIRIAIACDNLTLGKTFLKQLQNIVLSPQFRAVFPNLIPPYPPHSPKSDWASRGFSINRSNTSIKESTVTLLSPGSKTEGFHFDLIIGNDLVNEENYNSQTKRDRTKRFWQNFPNLKDNPNTPVVVEGTFWHEDDLYNDLVIDNPEYDIFYLPLYDSYGNITFPEKFTPELIERIKNQVGDLMFATQYLLTPIASERTVFHGCPIIRYKEILDSHGEIKYRKDELGREFNAPMMGGMVAMDPAGEGEDLEGAGYMEKDSDGYYFQRVLQLMPRWYPHQKLELFEQFDEEFDPDYFGIELDSMLEFDSILPEEAVRGNSKISPKLYKLLSKQKAKIKRVSAAQPLMKQKRILFHEDIPEKVIKDIQYYPEMKDDAAPDILGYELQMFNELGYYATSRDKKYHSKVRLPRNLALFKGKAVKRARRRRLWHRVS
jgi:hypothetical protein